MSAGLKFCRGLYAKHSFKLVEAIRDLNAARKDSKWSTEALLQMIEIYLAPDTIASWATLSDDDAGGGGNDDIPDISDT